MSTNRSQSRTRLGLMILALLAVMTVGLQPVTAQGPDPVDATLSDAFGVEAALALAGAEVLRIPPTPQVVVRLPGADGETEASDSLIETGPLGDDPRSVPWGSPPSAPRGCWVPTGRQPPAPRSPTST